MKIEQKDQAGPLENDDFVPVVLVEQSDVRMFQYPKAVCHSQHVPVERAKETVFQIRLVHQAPLPASVLI